MKHDQPKPPPYLTGEPLDLWQRLQNDYKISDAGGLLLLQTVCESFARMRIAQNTLHASGLTVYGGRGAQRVHPAVAIERDSRAAMLSALKMLNLDLEPLRDGPGRPPGK